MGAGGGSRLLESTNAATEDAGGEWGHEKDRGVRTCRYGGVLPPPTSRLLCAAIHDT